MKRFLTLTTLAVLSSGVASVPMLAHAETNPAQNTEAADGTTMNDQGGRSSGMTGNTQSKYYPTKQNNADETAAYDMEGNRTANPAGAPSSATDGAMSDNSSTAMSPAKSNQSTLKSAASTSVNNIPDAGSVMLSGTVQSVKDEKFTLADSTGSITVHTPRSTAASLKKGDQVKVSGIVDKGVFSTDIKSTNVSKVGSATMQ